eukprot:TRINITY_DN99675_c0_g1_i1.p1 TRINITY_DN99675_c0_g1~~TRINITY_DN99675_c0_g1_i1.p1  ORF type:complete len:532 (-),score=151.91 TRINITY_DN99675_c0_g1_i1:73-1596(-)
MSLFGGDNEIGNMLQEAVKLKSAQMGAKRKTYETWPYFLQHTLFHGEKEDFKAWRQLPFDEKIVICERIKEEGNQLYAKGSWMDAVDKYEEAPTLIQYCYSTDPGWRKNQRGIDDDVLVLVEDKGETEEDFARREKLRLQCCLNLAACKQKLGKLDEAIIACDVALQLDPNNVKALYRRAESRIRPTKATAYDHDLAIKDLTQAYKADPKNQSVEKLLFRLRADRKKQRSKDVKTFGGFFDRGQIYNKAQAELEEAMVKAKARPSAASLKTAQDDIQERIDNIKDDDPLEKRCQDAELLRDLYMRNGKEDEAQELNEQIKEAKQAVKSRSQPVKMDWDNPTDEMIADAKQHDLDLTDPMVIQELKRLEEEGYINGDGSAPSEPPPPPPPPPPQSKAKGSSADPQKDDSDKEAEEPVPWARYFILFAVIWGVFKILDLGICASLLAGGTASKMPPAGHDTDTSLQNSAADGLDLEDEEIVNVKQESFWISTYKNVIAFIGWEGPETEL